MFGFRIAAVFGILTASTLIGDRVGHCTHGVGCGPHGIAETTFKTTFAHAAPQRRLPGRVASLP